MSNWKVSVEEIKLFPHPNPEVERMELGKLGSYQVVVEKGIHKDGNKVVFIPEKSILPDYIKKEFENYLAGPNKDRVKSVRLKGEFSCGIILPLSFFSDKNLDSAHIGEDISEILGVTKYEPPIPVELAGKSEAIKVDTLVGKHDCEQFGVYQNEFVAGERVIVTEKIHGTQGVYYANYEGDEVRRWVSSKGQLSKGLSIIESDTNSYWLAAKNINLWETIDSLVQSLRFHYVLTKVVQVFGEVIPAQGGYNYGQSAMVLKIFDVRLDGVSIPYDGKLYSHEDAIAKVWPAFSKHWVPVIYDGAFDADKIREMCKGSETVSGKSVHIREGVVVRPYIDRYAADGTKLRVKIINPKYKATGEEIS